MGAPLMRDVATKRRRPAPEQVVVEGLRLAHTDASVARALPVMLWANRDRLRLSELVRRARRAKEGGALGFFLDLTSKLARSRPFAVATQDLKHDRPPTDVFFFEDAEKSLVGKELATLNTPQVARRWRFLMNMPIDSFETLFRKTFGASPSSGT